MEAWYPTRERRELIGTERQEDSSRGQLETEVEIAGGLQKSGKGHGLVPQRPRKSQPY